MKKHLSYQERVSTMLDAFTKTSKSILLEGDIGTGKTSFIRKYAEDRGRFLRVLIGSTKAPEDFSGQPRAVQDEDGTVVTEQTILRWFKDFIDHHPDGIIFIDEITTVPLSLQAAMLTLIQDREIDGYRLPDGVTIVAACNPADIATNGMDLSPAMANRFCHIKWNPPSKDTIDGLAYKWGADMDDDERDLRAGLAAFLRDNPGLIHNRPTEDIVKAGHGWPSQRSWDQAMEVLACLPHDEEIDGPSIRMEVLEGFVGDLAALEYLTFMRNTTIPSARAVLDGEEEIEWDDEEMNDSSYLRFLFNVIAVVKSDPDEYWQKAVDLVAESAERGKTAIAASVVPELLVPANRPANVAFPASMASKFGPMFKAAGVVG